MPEGEKKRIMLTLNATSSERLNVDHHRRRTLDKDTVGIQLHKHTYQRRLIILFYLHVFEPPAEQHREMSLCNTPLHTVAKKEVVPSSREF